MDINIAYISPKEKIESVWMEMKDELSVHLKKEVSAEIKKEMKKRAKGWRHKPRFATKFKRPRDIIGDLFVYPSSGEGADHWRMVSGGSKPYRGAGKKGTPGVHGIPSVPPPRAAMPISKYRPKTMPGGVYGQRSRRYPPHAFIAPGPIWHPGIEPRNFEKDIADDIKVSLGRGVADVMERVLQRHWPATKVVLIVR